MSYNYAVIGSGRQGIASAYDFVKYGEAAKVIMADINFDAAKDAAGKVNGLTGKPICEPVELNVKDNNQVISLLTNIDSMVSAVPYKFNLELTKCAIKSKTNMTDLGGNTAIVKEQIKLNNEAKNNGISIVPDCGMDPGLNISLISYIFEIFDSIEEIKSYGAGLPQHPVPPWNYELYFNLNGLTNEYYGNAIFIENGKVKEVPCFDGFEVIDFPEPLGKLEAAVTSGGLSTLPYELEGKIKTLTNKTLRYPGHWNQFKAYSQLGLFDEKPLFFNGCQISPREFYHFLIGPKIKPKSNKDVGIISILAKGIINGENKNLKIELIDYYDENTGLTAMQKLTGWHASVISILSAQNKTVKGAVPVHQAVSGKSIIEEFRKRGLIIKIELG